MDQVSQLQLGKEAQEETIPELVRVQAEKQPMERIQVMLPSLGRDNPCDNLWPGLAIEREFTKTIAKDE